MIGKKILHYQIIEKLGEGGMGIVYLAEDTKLKRQVAIKFLPQHIAGNSDERKRFEIEAQAAAALNHPNIATIFAIEHTVDDLFIVMEYIDGQELGGKITADRQLPIADCIDIATQIADGLQAAHEKGIVHRDIKSSNIMITDKGQVKIMDFGLAKVHGGAQLTQIGTTLGTIGYMSPEQARGEDVDLRSDIWSLGVLLYELITGQLPFKGDYEQAIIYCILNEKYAGLDNFRPDVPPELKSIVEKALEKDADKRYRQTKALIDDLKRMAEKPALATKESAGDSGVGATDRNLPMKKKFHGRLVYPLAAVIIILLSAIGYFLFDSDNDTIESLAILPFVNASNDTDTDYLSDGVTASLINRLTEITGLKVMSRHSVARFKEKNQDPLAAGRLMAVQSVLTGQLDIRGEHLLVDVELLNVDDGRQLWGDRFERDRSDILNVERDIVKRIGDKLKIKISGDGADTAEGEASIDPLAYDLYLRGRYIMLGTSDDGPARAQEYFRKAIEYDPGLAVAYAGLGESYVTQAWLGSRNRDEIIPLAKAALSKAMELDDQLSEAYVLAGEIALYFDWEWGAAKTAYEKAIDLKPGSDLAHREYANYLSLMDRPDEAIAEAQIAQTLDPLSVYATHQLGYSLLSAGRLTEAATEFSKAIDLNPAWVWGNIKLGLTYALMGEQEKAIAAMKRADELLAGKVPSPLAQSWLAQIAYICGDPERVKSTLARLESQAQITFVDPIAFADIYQRIGDLEKCFEYLELGYQVRTPLMAFLLLERRFLWKQIAQDSRYLSLIERLNFPVEIN